MSTRLTRIITVVFSIALVFSSGYFFVINNLQDELVAQQNNEFLLEKNLRSKQTQIKHALNYQQQITKFNTTYALVKKQLSINITVPLLLDQLAKIAKSHNVLLKTVQPLPIKQQSWLMLHPIRLVLIGNYYQISHFVITLVNTLHFVTLPTMKLTKIKDNKLSMRMLGIIYNQVAESNN